MTPRAIFNGLAPFIVAPAIFLSGYSRVVLTSEETSVICPILMALGAALFLLIVVSEGISADLTSICVGGLVMILLQLFSTIVGPPQGLIDTKELVRMFAQLVLVVSWFGFCTSIDWLSFPVRTTVLGFGLLILGANAIAWVLSGFGRGDVAFGGISYGKNALALAGAVGIGFGFFYLYGPENKSRSPASILLIFLGCISLYASKGRATQLVVILAGVAALIVMPLTRRWRLHQFTFVCLALIVYAVPVLYVNIQNYSLFDSLEAWSRSQYEHSLLSGRNSLWPTLIEDIQQRPLFGWGTGYPLLFTRQMDTGIEVLSPHNLYLSTGYRSGFVGLLGLSIYFWTIWTAFRRLPFNYWSRLSAACFIGIVLRDCTEVTLTHNGLDYGVGQWAIVAAGLSVAESLTAPDSAIDLEIPPEELL